ncbi:phosphatase PAP2 family protein [Streptomyces griseobrunneus]
MPQPTRPKPPDRPPTPAAFPASAGAGPSPRRERPRHGLVSTSPVTLLLAFAGLYLLAVWTPLGQAAENALVRGYADDARILALTESWGLPPFTNEEATLLAGAALIVVVAALRRRWREGCAALVTVVGTLAVTELLSRFVLGRPDLVHAPQSLIAPSFPSGHVAIAVALVLGCVLVASASVRPYVVAVGCLWIAVTVGGVQSLYWHRPSDVLGATLLACACYGLAVRLLKMATVPAATRSRARLPLAVAAVGALLASSREDAVARPLVFAAAALACAALVHVTVLPPSSVTRAPRAHRE